MSYQLEAQSLDDLLRKGLEQLIADGEQTDPTKGAAVEHRGVTLVLSNPLARLSRSQTRGKLFSALGEFCWYMSRSSEPAGITYYISKYAELVEDGILRGAYGPRLFDREGHDQIAGVIERLRSHPFSRRAVIQIFDHSDVAGEYKDVPCTTSLQFFVRGESLELVVTMRSNDAYVGLPHDVFAFTMIQELVARSLNLKLGRYVHMVGSFHFYERDRAEIDSFLREGWQEFESHMPAMPEGDPREGLEVLLASERAIREGDADPQNIVDVRGYWGDLARLLLFFNLTRHRHRELAGEVRAAMEHPSYDAYLQDREDQISRD